MERTCRDCQKVLSLTEENFFRAGRPFRGHCKACHRLRGARWEANNPAARKRLRRPQGRPAGDQLRLAALPKGRPPWVNAELHARNRAKTAGAPCFLTPAEKRRLRVYYHMAHLGGLEVDHVVALRDGGAHHPGNVQLLPAVENIKKGVRERDLRKHGGVW